MISQTNRHEFAEDAQLIFRAARSSKNLRVTVLKSPTAGAINLAVGSQLVADRFPGYVDQFRNYLLARGIIKPSTDNTESTEIYYLDLSTEDRVY